MQTSMVQSEARVDSSRNFSVKVDKASLPPGSYTFIAEPMHNWTGQLFDVVLLPALAWMLSGLCWVICIFSLPARYAHSVLFHAIILAPAFIFSARIIMGARKRRKEKLSHPPMKFVFYQPKARPASQAYRHEPTQAQATYEVHFRGEIKERGIASGQRPILETRSEYCKSERRLKMTASIQLASDIKPDSLARNDPFLKEHASRYLVFERYETQSSVQKIRELRAFLGLPLESEHDIHLTSKETQGPGSLRETSPTKAD